MAAYLDKKRLSIILPISTLFLAIVFVLSNWSSTGVLSNSALEPTDTLTIPLASLQQPGEERKTSQVDQSDAYRCFSWRVAEIRNVTELADGSKEWTSTWVWHERSEDFCSSNSSQNYQWIDMARLEDYANDEGKPRHTEFKLMNGTVLSVNEP